MNPFHIAILNFFFCIGIFWSCICCLNAPECKGKFSYGASYSVVLTGALAMGLQPLFFQRWPSIFDTVFSGLVFLYLIFTWLKGVFRHDAH